KLNEDVTRKVIDAVKAFGRFHYAGPAGNSKRTLLFGGGDVLGWRGERGERIGDLAREFKSDVGIERFGMSFFPFSPNETNRLDAFQSLSGGIMQDSSIVFSFNIFARDERGIPVPLHEMVDRMEFSIGEAKKIGVGYLVYAVSTPATDIQTIGALGLLSTRVPELRNITPGGGYSHIVTGTASPIGNAISIWEGEVRKPDLGNMYMYIQQEGCAWDGITLTVLTNGGVVPGCRTVCDARLKPFAFIFDNIETIQAGMEKERGIIKGLPDHTFTCARCEFHVKASWGEGG
ncbi:MAG: hypothetical protein NT157_02040, partial [Candidatus Micrarchaeota archaeon]|nr:hypothetical protein [Candidatus Micrarchaeota archaeon]